MSLNFVIFSTLKKRAHPGLFLGRQIEPLLPFPSRTLFRTWNATGLRLDAEYEEYQASAPGI